jgi:hypothetical protein
VDREGNRGLEAPALHHLESTHYLTVLTATAHHDLFLRYLDT